MERIDLYRDEFVQSGCTINRGDEIPDGLFSRIVFVCVFNQNGELLLQQRDPVKSWGGYWDVSAGGAVSSGESSREAASRELEEEMGICVQADDFVKLMSLYYDNSIHDIFSVTAKIRTEELKLQPGEVSAAKWASKEEVIRMVQSEEFIPVHQEFLELIMRMKTNQGIV